MRYACLLALVVASSLAACKKVKKEDPTPTIPAFDPSAPFGPKSAFLTGSDHKGWRYRRFLLNGSPQSLVDPCVGDFTLTFYKTNRVYTGSFSLPTVTCSATNGNWNLNTDETQLRLYPQGQAPVVGQFLELSDTLLHYTQPAQVNGQAASSEIWMVPR